MCLLVNVDDIVITGTNLTLIDKLKQQLQNSFHMKDLDNLTYFLGLEIHAGSHCIFLSQHKYAMDLVAAAGLQDLPPLDTPMEINIKLCRDEGDLLPDPTAYRTLVGSLIYLTNTRLDISYVVQQVSRFMASPKHLHMAAVRRIIYYVHGTIRRGLCHPIGTSLNLIAYSDANYIGCSDTRRSTTGFGYMGSLLSLVFSSVPLLLFMLIIQVLFTLLLILSSMSAPSILRWIATSFVMRLRLGLYLFLMCPAIFRWLTSSPKLSHASVIIFLQTN